MTSVARVVLHLDMDAFYAAVEIREDPSLAGKALIIGHRGRRGVVTTCSYEARKFGVRSAMPSVTAERLCPDATWLPGRMELYVAVSRKLRTILHEEAPVVEPLSIDEAFCDLTGLAGDLAAGAQIGARMRARIRDEQRLTASVGVAPNKFLAKVASDLEKPDALVVLGHDDIPAKLWPLPVRRLWGVGPKTAERLELAGLKIIRDVASAKPKFLETVVGSAGAAHLRALANGEDDREVVSNRAAKSISEERTYGTDLTDAADIDRALLARAEGVARALRQDGLAARTIHIKIRTGDFTTWTRASTLPAPTDLAEVIVREARALFRERIDLGGRGVRLLGVGTSGLEPASEVPSPLFVAADEARARRFARAQDAVLDKIGDTAVTRASLLRRKGPTDERGGEPDEASSLPSLD